MRRLSKKLAQQEEARLGGKGDPQRIVPYQ